MKTYLGKAGLHHSWSKDFSETVKCHKCKENARIAFVVQEGRNEEYYVCNLHKNGEDEKYWPHDAIACAIYICEKCFEPNALINQA